MQSLTSRVHIKAILSLSLVYLISNRKQLNSSVNPWVGWYGVGFGLRASLIK